MLSELRMTRRFAKVCLMLSCVAPVSFAQGPIRVETDQVLVPTVVFDKKLYAHKNDLKAQVEKDPDFWDTIAIRDLAASDFHLSEDGRDQAIVSVKLEAPTSAMIQDNQGQHVERGGTGGGRWSYPNTVNLSIGFPHYVIAYLPPDSPPGSCHQVRVSVGRPNVEVFSRSEYCNTKHSATDPLNGTEFGQKMERESAQPGEGKIDLAARAFAFHSAAGVSRAYIALEFPPQSLKHEIRGDRLYATIGVLGMIYSHDGTVVTRFSDFACCDYGNQKESRWKAWTEARRDEQSSSLLPYRYDKQIDLAPGDYVLEVLLSDGDNFGRRKIPLHVEYFRASELSISEIALCKRIRKAPIDPLDIPGALSGRYIPLVSKGQEFVPAVDSHVLKYGKLKALDLYFYFEIYAPRLEGQVGTTVQAHVRVVDPRTGDIKIGSQAVDTAPSLDAGSPFVFVGWGIHLDTLDAGPYEMEVQATDSAGRSTPWKKTAFNIEFVKSSPMKDYRVQ
jgi:hypothetical protein